MQKHPGRGIGKGNRAVAEGKPSQRRQRVPRRNLEKEVFVAKSNLGKAAAHDQKSVVSENFGASKLEAGRAAAPEEEWVETAGSPQDCANSARRGTSPDKGASIPASRIAVVLWPPPSEETPLAAGTGGEGGEAPGARAGRTICSSLRAVSPAGPAGACNFELSWRLPRVGSPSLQQPKLELAAASL